MSIKQLFVIGAFCFMGACSANAGWSETAMPSDKESNILLIKNSYNYCRHHPCSHGCKWYRKKFGDPCHKHKRPHRHHGHQHRYYY